MTLSQNWVKFVSFGGFAACIYSYINLKKIIHTYHNLNHHQEKQLYKFGLLELDLPSKSGSIVGYNQQLLHNDVALSRAVKEVEGVLCVSIVTSTEVKDSDILSYISEIYTKSWDEIIQAGRFGLKCIVLGDCCGLRSIENELSIEPLDVIFTNNPTKFKDTSSLRVSKGWGAVDIQDLSLCTSFNSSMIFLDAPGQDLPRFKKMALGGTFDRLHNGHRKLLTLSASLCTEELIIGVMSDELLQNKKGAHLIEKYEKRLQTVKLFMKFIKPSLQCTFVKLLDPFGPTITDGDICALVVSSETVSGAIKINELRINRGLQPLKILITRRSDAASLSSTFIRENESK